MNQQGQNTDGDESDSTHDFGWEDYTVNPGQYDVPKASDIQGNDGISFSVVEGSSDNGGLGWEDYTTKTDRNDIIESIDNADGQGSIFTLDNVHPMIGIEDNHDNNGDDQSKYPVVIKNAYLAERFGIDEKTLMQRCKKIGGNVLKIGIRAVLPNYAADLTAAGIDLI